MAAFCLQSSSNPSRMATVIVPSWSCPSDPRDIQVLPPKLDHLYSERLSSTITPTSITVSIDRMSPVLGYMGEAAMCIIDTNCRDPLSGTCVSPLGFAAWVGPSTLTAVDETCSQLESGHCRVTIPGSHMTSVNYNLPRLAVMDDYCSVSGRLILAHTLDALGWCTVPLAAVCCLLRRTPVLCIGA